MRWYQNSRVELDFQTATFKVKSLTLLIRGVEPDGRTGFGIRCARCFFTQFKFQQLITLSPKLEKNLLK